MNRPAILCASLVLILGKRLDRTGERDSLRGGDQRRLIGYVVPRHRKEQIGLAKKTHPAMLRGEAAANWSRTFPQVTGLPSTFATAPEKVSTLVK
jgi:hypothetical protein